MQNSNLPSFLRSKKNNKPAERVAAEQAEDQAEEQGEKTAADQKVAQDQAAGEKDAAAVVSAGLDVTPDEPEGVTGPVASPAADDQILPTLPGIPPAASPSHVPNPRADVEALDKLESHLYAHRYVENFLGCTGPSIDPKDATADRGEAMAILEQEDQELLCAPQTGDLLDRLSAYESNELIDETHRAQVRVLKRDRARLVDVPPEEQAAFSRLTTESDEVWRRAKAAGDWDSFEPYLERIVDAVRKLAAYKNPGADPYDVWLAENEQGTNQAFYDRFFGQVKDVVVPLLADVRASKVQVSRAPIEGHYDERRQWELASDLLGLEGLSPDSLFLASTEHPYSEAMTTNYTYIAAHVFPEDIMSNVFTMLHEGGHSLYEQGVNPAYNYTSLKGGTSCGMHEAQSRFFENYVGRDEAFSGVLLKALQKRFPGPFGRVTAHQLFLANNCVIAQPIRVDADELTYPLHILVRYEIEQELMSGGAKAADVPRLWAQKYREYLGIKVANDARGALQDTHWADGLFGYFPTYALGGAYGAQLRHAMIAEGLDWEATLSSGDLAPVREWLRQRVWRFGRAKDPADIIKDATGEPFVTRWYTDYLTEKFSRIYRL